MGACNVISFDIPPSSDNSEPAMRWPADYHMHTPLCRHATGAPSEYAARAVAIGLEEIGFSDHSPMPQDDFDNWRMRADQLAQYVEDVQRVRRDFPKLQIKLALEADYIPGYEEWVRELAARHPWDYLIGSVHYVSDGFAVDNPEDISKWKQRDAFEVWSIYFDRLARAAESGLFEIIGHADLPKKFKIYPSQDCVPLYEQFARRAARAGVAIELNTAGLRKDCREIYPCPALVQLAAREKIPITFGSDAHAPGEVGHEFAAALLLARSAGYTHSCHFTQRRRTESRL